MTDKPRPRTDEPADPSPREPTPADLDERFSLHPHDPEDVLRKLLGTSPEGRPADK